MWAQLAQAQPTAPDPAAATLKDDEEIIVVVDTLTGEVRQCGNFSGHCVASNPWAKGAAVQAAPATLLKHREQLEAEDRRSIEQPQK
jgi:hypothetical protein